MAEWSPPPHDEPTSPADAVVPMARPVALEVSEGVPTASYWTEVPKALPYLSRRRASVELIVQLVGGLAAAFALAVMIGAVASLRKSLDERWLGIIHTLVTGGANVLLCLLILRVARHPLKSIGLTTRGFGLNVGIGGGALLLAMALLMAFGLTLVLFNPELMGEPSPAQKGIEATFPRMPLPAMAAITVGVVFWEEVVFRGFLLTRLQAVFRRWWLSIPVGAALFGVPHLYQGPLAMGTITLLGVVMGMLFAWRRSLVPTIAFHFLFNMSAFLFLDEFSTTWQ